ncbi:MAG: PGPGW domain-containing protein [Pseudomonadota bacterium]
MDDKLPAKLPEHENLPARRRSRWKRLLILIAGWFFILLGIVGLFLPILQGLLFLAIGSYLLSLESPWVRRKMLQLQRRYPKLGATLDQARDRAAHYARRILGRKPEDKS